LQQVPPREAEGATGRRGARPLSRLRLATLLSFLSGAALTLAFPEPDLAFVAWIAPAGLLAAATATTWGRGAWLGFAFGLGFFGTLLYWISIIGWAGWLVLVLLQAAYIAVFGALWSLASRSRMPLSIVAAPVLWVALEYVRSLFPLRGFTWGQLAQSQHNLEWMLRPARFGGGWLVTFAVVLVAALVMETVRSARARRLAQAGVLTLIAAIPVLVPLAIPAASAGGKTVRVAIVQGNVPRDFTGSALDKERAILESHESLTYELPPGEVDLVIWPESSVGIDPNANRDVGEIVAGSARAAEAEMIVGANLDVDRDHYKVVALQVSSAGEAVELYEKTHLVPFGEYVPGRDLIGWLPMLDQVPRDAIAADKPTVFDVAGGEVAPVISFEGDFGSLVRTRIDEGGRMLVVATNTSTWGDSWASAQHVAFSQLRAAENGVWVIHAALSGISAFVAPDGTVMDRTSLWTATSLQRDVRFAEEASFYAHTGDWVAWLCLIGAPIVVVLGWRAGRRRYA
jgi:apolipoprotein N-acyltransferase